MARTIRIALIGTRFMGRAHSQAWLSAGRFFDLPAKIELTAVCGRDAAHTQQFADQWGWQDAVMDAEEIFANPDIDLVDIAAPNYLHASMALAALKAGKHVVCEKPLATTLDDARRMKAAADRAVRKKIRAFIWFNYRRVPALAFAHQMIRKGRLGAIHHVRAKYLQDWGGPATPLLWRFQKKYAGSGAHGDLNAHLIDLARFLTGDEIVEVSGALMHTFIPHRQLPNDRKRSGKSDVDDCALFLARFRSGAVGSFEATRVATGNLNRNSIEINGEHGSLRFDLERMNELEWWDNRQPQAERGWSRIMCTTPGEHPYIDAYWPPAHGLGYEHTFISQCADMIAVICGRKTPIPLPTFGDGWETQRVLEAAMISAREKQAVRLSRIK